MAIVVFLRKGPFDGKVHTVDAPAVGETLVVAGRVYIQTPAVKQVDGQDLPVYEYEYEAR